VKLKFAAFNETGFCSITFNQNLVRPFHTTNTKGRNLLSLDEIDVNRDLIGVDLVIRNDDESVEASLEFFIDLLEWNDRDMLLQVTFSDPLLLS
jgi:hypothetical protein